MSRFTTILWDVDGTLLDFLYSQRYALSKCFNSIGREINEDIINRYSDINLSFWKRLELGEITKAQLLPGRFIQLFEEYGITGVDVEAFRKEYEEGLGSVYSYIDDSLTIVKALQGSVKQYVITNGTAHIQLNKLKASGFYDIMDDVFISDLVGVPKPHKGFFDYCLAHIEERNKDKILLVGDSLSSDIKGGINAGIPTCWYREEGTVNNTELKPDYEICSLHRIFDILQMN